MKKDTDCKKEVVTMIAMTLVMPIPMHIALGKQSK